MAATLFEKDSVEGLVQDQHLPTIARRCPQMLGNGNGNGNGDGDSDDATNSGSKDAESANAVDATGTE